MVKTVPRRGILCKTHSSQFVDHFCALVREDDWRAARVGSRPLEPGLSSPGRSLPSTRRQPVSR